MSTAQQFASLYKNLRIRLNTEVDLRSAISRFSVRGGSNQNQFKTGQKFRLNNLREVFTRSSSYLSTFVTLSAVENVTRKKSHPTPLIDENKRMRISHKVRKTNIIGRQICPKKRCLIQSKIDRVIFSIFANNQPTLERKNHVAIIYHFQ